MSVGATLRNARERQGKSIEAVAQSTKINHSQLEALERDDIDRLPALVYTRGFVKVYARELGLDPDDTADRYFAQFLLETPPQAPAEVPLDYNSEPMSVHGKGSPRSLMTILTTAIIIGGIYFGVSAWPWWPQPGAQPAQATETAAAQPAPAAPVQPAVSETQPASDVATAAATVPPAGEVLHVILKAAGPCWVSATVDRRRVESRLLQPNETMSLEVREELSLRVGDPGSLAYSIDGVSGRPLGDAGRPVTVKITRENYREFLGA